MVVASLSLARSFLFPIVASCLLALMLSPPVQLLIRWHVPKILASLIMITFSSSLVIGAGYLTTPAITHWIKQAPISLVKMLDEEQELKDTISSIKKTSKQVSNAVSQIISQSDTRRQVLYQQQDWLNKLLNELKTSMTLLLLIMTLTLFLLVSGDGLIFNLIRLNHNRLTRRQLIALWRRLPGEVGRYLGAAFLTNLVTGLITSSILWYLNVPMPWVWLVLVTFARFIPYIGVAAVTLLIFAVALSDFHHFWLAFTPAAIFLVLTTIIGMFVDPLVHGMRLKVNPIVVFVSVIFWGWLWGIVGAIIAVPMLTVALVVSQSMGWHTLTRIVTTRSS
ncbi:AI-2E family transporter [Celerinatantimonas diazotrophica]|nr:AI-2E family transporter [Celerinatantimonas diazotrophica]